MSVETDIVAAISSRVSGRAYVNVFAQPPERPAWPAARVTVVSAVPDVDLCGDGGEDTADIRAQIDLVVAEAAGYAALKALQLLVMSDMAALNPPAISDGWRIEFDEETRTHRCSLDYIVYPSSPEESP